MRSARRVVLLPALLVCVAAAGMLAVACGGGDQPAVATQKEAIQAYCDANGIEMPDLNVSGDDGYGDKPTVSVEDPAWEIDYAFPAAQEGAGEFFLLRETEDGWTVVAHTSGDRTGWTADELADLGAPGDLAEQPVQ